MANVPNRLTKEDLKGIEVVNVAEMLVDDQFPEVMRRFPNACHCKRCLADIKALALNHIQPRYVSTHNGNMYERVNMMDMLVRVDALRAMTEAATKVIANPRHDLQDNA